MTEFTIDDYRLMKPMMTHDCRIGEIRLAKMGRVIIFNVESRLDAIT